MAELNIKKASLKNVRARIAIDGPSGAGKTYSSLLLARGLVGPNGRICICDSERSRSEGYASDARIGDFDVLELNPPFTPQNYIDAFKKVFNSGYDILICDSLSHVWIGEGGILSAVSNLRGRGTNEFAIWKGPSEQFNRLMSTIVSSPIHIICTMRSKTAYEIVENASGKKIPQKVGLAPVIRDGAEFEFDVYFSIDTEHKATLSKCNAGFSRPLSETLLVEPMITPELGASLRNWLSNSSGPPPAIHQAALAPSLQERLGNAASVVGDELFTQALKETGLDSIPNLTNEQGEKLLEKLNEKFLKV